jgi:XTP/dITP diphosphohydrolase
MRVAYVTTSNYKRQEFAVIEHECRTASGKSVRDVVDIELVQHRIPERLEGNLEELVQHEAVDAYRHLKRPCFVEHAGLVIGESLDVQFPGGITKALWDVVGYDALLRLAPQGTTVLAKAAVAYCDGMQLKTFCGITKGILSDRPRGKREFYWDTVFIPTQGNPALLTYAEIVEKHSLAYKVIHHSQSRAAIMDFIEWHEKYGFSALWR